MRYIALILAFSLASCAGIKVRVDTDCQWARTAPDLTVEQTGEIVASNVTDSTLAALNELDDFVGKHNELYERYCK